MVDNQTALANNQPTLNNQSEEPQSQEHSQDKVESESKPNAFAEQFSRISKQEKFIADERRKIEEAKKAFETNKQEVEKYRGLKGKDPFDILDHFGISYEQLLEADKNRRTTPMDPMAKKALETVEQLRMELDRKEHEAEKARHSRAEIKLFSEIDAEIRKNEFDLIDKLGEQNAVRDYMEEIFNETGEIPDIKEACEAVNNKLVARFSAIKDSKWLRAQEPVAQVEETDHTPKKAALSGALSNKMTQSIVHNDKPMTEKERLSAAIAAMNAVKSK